MYIRPQRRTDWARGRSVPFPSDEGRTRRPKGGNRVGGENYL